MPVDATANPSEVPDSATSQFQLVLPGVGSGATSRHCGEVYKEDVWCHWHRTNAEVVATLKRHLRLVNGRFSGLKAKIIVIANTDRSGP